LQHGIRQRLVQSHTDLYNFNIIYTDNHIATFSFTYSLAFFTFLYIINNFISQGNAYFSLGMGILYNWGSPYYV
jgi:hypothetical protein